VAGAIGLGERALQAHREQIIRKHDPCISCAAHFLKLQLHRT
jgi:coenzyme F420-reducing hydrogenase alpha subunit